MRLEHHLVGGYVRYISPHIIIILLYIVYAGTKFPIYKVRWLREASQIRQTFIPLCEKVV